MADCYEEKDRGYEGNQRAKLKVPPQIEQIASPSIDGNMPRNKHANWNTLENVGSINRHDICELQYTCNHVYILECDKSGAPPDTAENKSCSEMVGQCRSY